MCQVEKVNKVTTANKGGRQKLLSGFFPLRGYPHPPPLNGKSFCQKTLSRMRGYPPPLNGKLPKIFLKKWVKKG